MKKVTLAVVLTCFMLFTGCNDNSLYSKYNVAKEQKIENKTYTTYNSLTYDEYSEKIKNNDSFILLLWRTGCSHCETFEPKLKEVISHYNLNIYGLNLADLSEKESSIVENKTFVTGTPTMVYIKDGKYSTKMVGDKDEQELIDFLVECGYLEEK